MVEIVAPKRPGHLVRRVLQEGTGVPALVAVQQDAPGPELHVALANATGVGRTRAGVSHTTIKDETETDLFVEQPRISGGVTARVTAGFEI